jgi:membrane protein
MIYGTNLSVSFLTIKHKDEWKSTAAGILAGIATAVALVAAVVAAPFTGGLSLGIIIGIAATSVGVGYVVTQVTADAIPPTFKLPIFLLTPEAMFANEVPLLDVNFFSETRDGLITDADGNKYIETITQTGQKIKMKSTAIELRPVISKWYFALRNLAIVALLSILVYIGIRILISSSADDKAKYKQRMMDWLVAMCLLFFMHYIMAFAVKLTEEITKAVNSMNEPYYITFGDSDSKLKDYKYEAGSGDSEGENIFNVSDGLGKTLYDNNIITDYNGKYIFMWPTNLTGKARIELQLEPTEDLTEDDIEMRQFGYTVIYLALVMYTILFLFRYLKRVMMLAFLTIIAPLMAMTYPLDKLQDGSAQGFNTWLKEYIFNLLIQPVHLILYTVLIGASMDLVADNIVFALVALGFILQAEKILRKFFGFEKASTVAGGSALGGALAMQGISQMSKLIAKGGKGGKPGGGGNNGGRPGDNRRVRTADSGRDTNSLIDETYGSGNGQDNARQVTSGQPENQTDNGTEQQTAQQAMLDVYDEGFGTDEWDPQERDAMAREAYADSNEGMNYSADEYAQILRDSGYNESEIADMVRESYGDNTGSEESSGGSNAIGAANQTTQSEGRGKRLLKSFGRGAVRGLKGTAYIAPKAARFLTKTAVKGTLMGAGAIAGVTAGLVSDDFSNVVKYGMAGIGAGALASSGVNSIPDGVESIAGDISNGLNGIYEATHTKDENEARQNRILDKQALRDPERVRKYQEELKVSKKEAHRIMKEEAQKYREAGVTDDKLIIKAMKASRDDFGADRASNQRILLAQMAGKVGDDQKKLKQIKEGLVERGVPKGDIDNYIKTIKDINKII